MARPDEPRGPVPSDSPSPPVWRRISLQRALLAVLAISLVAGILPAGLALDAQLARELEARARRDLALARLVLADRNVTVSDAMMMRAKDLTHTPGLAEVLWRDDGDAAQRIAGEALPRGREEAVVVARDGRRLVGPDPGDPMLAATRLGEMPVAVVPDGGRLFAVGLAPVMRNGIWAGAVGVATELDDGYAASLAGLTRSDVIVLHGERGVVASSLPDTLASAIAAGMALEPVIEEVGTVRLGDRRYLTTAAPLDGTGRIAFVRDMGRELAVLPMFRRVMGLSGLAAIVLGLGLGALLAARVARPVRALATAADRLASGDFAAPIAGSRLREADSVGQALEGMRGALAARLEELEAANRRLAERQAKLAALQTELIQRDRLAASGRLVVELAHEIRNPVASLRNCLEVLHRRLEDDPAGQEFANLAIDELLRMHELAENMLDLHRPREERGVTSSVAEIAREVARLVRAGAGPERLSLSVGGEARARIAPDALKQVLLNLIQNAREAAGDAVTIAIRIDREDDIVVIEVEDDGPGIPEDALPRVFDPFFTTKGSVHGTGLGLFVAEGIVRRSGGRISAANRGTARGALFRIELVPADRGAAAVGGASGAPEGEAGP